MKNRCANYDKEIECCRILSDWSEAMPALQPCIESPCKYFKPYTNYDRIKSMSVEEMANFFDKIVKENCTTICSHLDKCLRNNAIEPICKNHYKQWLLQEVSDERI